MYENLLKIPIFMIILLAIPSICPALDDNEELSIKLLRRQTDTFITIDRGVEDGINKGDHAKLYLEGDFVCRAIAINVEMMTSHWKIYQILDKDSLISGESYSMIGISQSLIPADLKQSVADITVKPARKRLEIKNQEEEVAQKEKSKPQDIMSALNVDASQMRQDMSEYDVNLSASPISFSTERDQTTLSYSASVRNRFREKYELETFYSYYKNAYFDPDLDKERTSSNNQARIVFDINKIYGNWTYFGLMEFQRQRDDLIYPIRRRISGGITGIKYDFYESETIQDLSLSYIPILEYQVSDRYDYTYDPITFQSSQRVVQDVTNKVRHSFRFRFRYQKNNFSISEELFWKPYHDLPNKKLDTTDTLTTNQFTLSYFFGQHVSFSYNNSYSWDILRKRSQNLPSSIMTHSFSFGVNFSI